ncbi:uncharacterized protein LOC143146950 [Ptiloglossa arizonensis]|uniref:uncharacterized protein LOC143146950 n=1 Tax=Ptiloglossa arizonensis TaxID=3350558 RepID=UPI003F9FB173
MHLVRLYLSGRNCRSFESGVRPLLLVASFVSDAWFVLEEIEGKWRHVFLCTVQCRYSIILGPSREKAIEEDQNWDRTHFDSGKPPKGSTPVTTDVARRSKDRLRYLQSEEELGREASDRLERNLDQIGGGNLLRRGLHEREYDIPRWQGARRNLDQIGGGNLLRDVNDRVDRNLDQIGGGNLVRSLDGVVIAAEDLRRNLDQIGGGNLVRGLARKLVA